MLSFTILERFAAGLPPAVWGPHSLGARLGPFGFLLRGVSTMAARSTRARAKPAPWKTDASADLDRFGTRPRPSKGGSRGRDSDPSDAASDRWETTSTRSFGARTLASARAADFPPEATLWTTTNADLQYDPREFVDPNWRALGVSTDRPIRERALRRSRVADPAGTGESAVGGWAGVPRTRLGGADPLRADNRLGDPNHRVCAVGVVHEGGVAGPEVELHLDPLGGGDPVRNRLDALEDAVTPTTSFSDTSKRGGAASPPPRVGRAAPRGGDFCFGSRSVRSPRASRVCMCTRSASSPTSARSEALRRLRARALKRFVSSLESPSVSPPLPPFRRAYKRKKKECRLTRRRAPPRSCPSPSPPACRCASRRGPARPPSRC